MKKLLFTITLTLVSLTATCGERYNFNAQWLLALGDLSYGADSRRNDKEWKRITLPYAFNQTEAYSRNCSELSDTVMWYRKHFVLPKTAKGKRILIEFEGARFGATVYINGHRVGIGENGVMAFGFDLTPYINYKGDNMLAVRVDNDWRYHETSSGSSFQWNNKNFYCNYGGINKNVWLHIMDNVHQTLPLFSGMGTTGVYVYASSIDTQKRSATVNVEAQVINSSNNTQRVQHRIVLLDKDGQQVADFLGEERSIAAGDTITMKAARELQNLHLWSWGYGYLYTVKSMLVKAGKPNEVIDSQDIRTGFRKIEYKDGMFYLNDRVLQLKGFAQRSTNEWPAAGISIPVWMTDYSNSMILGCNGNFVRWMHVTPSKQDVLSFDRLGLIQAMPAGDAEKDVNDRRWQQRLEVMRDAIIYNRNNPSVIFYEGGNNQISEEHMADLLAIRNKYDANGGRAIGSRNMLDSKVAEYGGEMLYVNKSAGKPMWQMEYNRDEGIRRYWDEWSFPYHKEGDGPMYRGAAHVVAYNHNQDGLAVENIVRWNEYWLARPGSGKRVNSGGAKIIFSDSNTHARGEKNYRTSGDVDAMRIPKDSYFCHKVMWNGWVDNEQHGTHIIGHWNYDVNVEKPVYVCSTGDEVELFLNGQSLGKGKRSDTFLFTWDKVRFAPGTLRAVSRKDGKDVSSHQLKTAGAPAALRMTWVGSNGNAFRADGADMRIAEVEAVDKDGNRCPLAASKLHFSVEGQATYLGGISGVVKEEERLLNETMTKAHDEGREITLTGASAREGHSTDDNAILSPDLQLEAGVCRVMVRSTTTAGDITLKVESPDLPAAALTTKSQPCRVKNGFYVDTDGMPTEADWAKEQPLWLERGETPATPSYTQRYEGVAIKSIEVPVNVKDSRNLCDDNEASKWSSDGLAANAWLKATLTSPAAIRKVSLRMNNFRTTAYPLQVIAVTAEGEKTVWQGYTQKNLGDCYLHIDSPVVTDTYIIRMIGEATVKEAFASMTELAAKKTVSTEASISNILSVAEIEFDK